MELAFGCIGNTIRLRSGLYLNLAEPKPDQFTFRDIAGGLSKICRFGGQTEKFYSVAEHSWHCAQVAKDDGLSLGTQVAALMHDAAEAFLGDVVKPLKIMLPDYKRLESLMETVIAEKFLIDFDRERQSIAEIDHAILIAERNSLFVKDSVLWTGEEFARKLEIRPNLWNSVLAEQMFVQKARIIGIDILA